MNTCQNAVVFIVFNRPDRTLRVWEKIREAKPPKLYVIADGARADRPGELESVQAVRKIVRKVDWPCEVIYDCAEKNEGDFARFYRALDLAFEKEDQIIWLEDDCLPDSSFFEFCDCLLERYKNDERINYIGGSNLLWGRYSPREDYFLSRYCLPWGLALWKRSYEKIRPDLSYWMDPQYRQKVLDFLPLEIEKEFWTHIFDDLYHRYEAPGATELKSAVDYYWKLAFWAHESYALLPRVNLIQNIGFGAQSTHTQKINKSHIVPLQHLRVDCLKHPEKLMIHEAREEWLFRVYCYYEEARPWKRLYNYLKIKGGFWKNKLLNLVKTG